MAKDLSPLFDKHNRDSLFSVFLEDWKQSEDCSLYRWCAEQDVSTLGEALDRFDKLLSRQPEIARVVHYHIGFLVEPEIRNRWFEYVHSNSVECAVMYIENETLTDEQDKQLLAIVCDPRNGAPAYANAIASGELVRKKTERKPYNEDSEIVQGILNG